MTCWTIQVHTKDCPVIRSTVKWNFKLSGCIDIYECETFEELIECIKQDLKEALGETQ